MTSVPDATYLAALAALRGVGPARLGRLVQRWTPAEAWDALAGVGLDVRAIAGSQELARRWQTEVRDCDLVELWGRYRKAGIGVLGRGAPAYPQALIEDPEPPEVLFTSGDPGRMADSRVAIVGTRQCTRYGVDVARELGHLLASNGVSVISGLARGIDAAAHAGALEAGGAPPVGVVGTGLDVVYPRQNRALWERIARHGLLCSEAPLGAAPERWRFPARNRIIAGLAQVTVVVESHDTGGSLYTAAQAIDRGRLVLAVPGPIRSPASLGCHRLLADGCHPLCDFDDVLVALGLVAATTERPAPRPVTASQQRVLHEIGWQPALLEDIVSGSGLGLTQVARIVEELRAQDLVAFRGPWLERTSREVTTEGSNGPEAELPDGARPRGAP